MFPKYTRKDIKTRSLKKRYIAGICAQCTRLRLPTNYECVIHNMARRVRALKNIYGLSFAAYQEMKERFDWRCHICLEYPPGKTKLHVDHDHVTKVVRGLLCIKCNQGLWSFKDNPQNFHRAASYLESAGVSSQT